MALIFCDGFDHYGTDDLLKKWNCVSHSSSYIAINSSIKRTGTSSLRFTEINAGRYIYKNTPSLSTMVIGYACYLTSVNTGNPAGVTFKYNDNPLIDILIQEDFKVHIHRNTTELAVSDSVISGIGEWFYFTVKIYIHDTEGYVSIYKGDTLFYEITGIDTKEGDNNYVNRAEVKAWYKTGMYVDDFYIDDSDILGDIKVETLYPSGAGNSTQWDALSGSNYENVDETPQDGDTSYVSTATADEIDTYAFGNLTTTAGTVYGVQVNMVARKDDAGSRSIAPVVRPASTDRVGTTQSIGDAYMDYIQIYTVNPEDSAAWEIADVNGAEFGVKLIE